MAVRAGPYVLGVRADSEATVEVLRSLLGPHVIDDGHAPDPNFSVRVAGPRDGPGRALHRLHRGHDLVGRTRTERGLLEVLAEHLEAFGSLGREGVVDLHASLLVRDDGAAVMAPPDWLEGLAADQRRLAEEGWRLVHRGLVGVEAGSGRVLVSAPRLVPDGALERAVPDQPSRDRRRAGRFDLRRVLLDPHGDASGSVSRASALAGLTGRVESMDRLGAAVVLAGLAAMLEDAEPLAVPRDRASRHLP